MLTFLALLALPASGAAGAACAAPRAVAKKHVVQVKDMTFVPATVVASPGDTVVWENTDIVPHTVTSRAWDSGSIAAGGRWTHVFTARGVVAYKCTFHPTMTGTITVR